jgi:hypothetical protein
VNLSTLVVTPGSFGNFTSLDDASDLALIVPLEAFALS